MIPKAILIDLDGTLYSGDQPIHGSNDTLQFLADANIPFCFITNTTRMIKSDLATMLNTMGLLVDANNICTAPEASAIYCRNKRYKKIMLVVPDKNMEKDFHDFNLVTNNPDAIILGDLGQKLTFDLLNKMFNLVMDGAELIAMHKNRYWNSGHGFTLDAGPIVAALEDATGINAIVVGKPSIYLFKLASQQWNFNKSEILMVGDDIWADIGGARNANMPSVLVKTGKFRKEQLKQVDFSPNFIINSFADLPNIIN